ncbi:N-acetylmuramoyl-L-alanine amidase [Ideonella sp.]|uniref:N-acetylmuramoyl-L-alanine amidase n=1 Tax=Ideonella sp. TaxID=1929293 RepID=UPI003BB76F71
MNTPLLPTPAAKALAITFPANVARFIDLVVIHCSATPSGQWLGGIAPGKPAHRRATEVIDAWHAARGFHRVPAARAVHNPALSAIGYHAVIDLDGAVLTGRAWSEVGAHVAGFNQSSVGICLVGGAEPAARYTAAQWAALAQVLSAVSARFQVPLQAPVRTPLLSAPGFRANRGVCGHRDLSPDANRNGRIERGEWLKTCPGFDLQAWLAAGMQPTADQLCNIKG